MKNIKLRKVAFGAASLQAKVLVTPWKSVPGGYETVVTPVNQGELVFLSCLALEGPRLGSGRILTLTKLTLA